MSTILQVFYTLFSALLTALAIPNEFFTFGSPFLGLFALVPYYITIFYTQSFKKAGLLCSLQLGSVHLLTSFWLGNFKDFALFTLGASSLVYFIFGFFLGQLLYIANSYTKKLHLQERAGTIQWSIPIRILSFASLWTLYEYCKSIGFLGYPWGTILKSAYKWKLISQICAITGTWGLTFLFSLFSAVFAEGLIILQQNNSHTKYSSYINTAAFCMTLFILSTTYGIFEYTKNRTPTKTVHAILVQENTNSWEENPVKCIENSIKLSQQGLEKSSNQKIDTIIWSESTLRYSLPESYDYYTRTPVNLPLIKFITETNVPFIIGCPYTKNRKKSEYYNAVNFFSKDGTIEDWYGKIHLVPFAEGISEADKKWLTPIMNLLVGFSSPWSSGPKFTLFNLPIQNAKTVKFTTPICFEDAFPSICRNLWKQGSEVFINLTNDSWSLKDSAEYQHFVIASYRAIEMRTTLVRSTNAGYSVVVNPVGKILDDMPLFTTMAKPMQIPIYERQYTIYCFLGDWLPKLLFILIILGALFLKRKEKN